MRPHKIKTLIDLLPVSDNYANRVLSVMEMREAEAQRFSRYYKDLAFGWNFATAMQRHKLNIPGLFDDDDYYVLAAYQFQTDPYYHNPALAAAYSIYSDEQAYNRNLVEACILAEDTEFSVIANYTGIPEDVLTAYEKLFFNIRDRRDDTYIIAQHLYPNTRLETLVDDHMLNVDQGLLMKRSAYHNGIDDVIFFAGFKENVLNTLSKQATTVGSLEGMLMANGLILARNGWLNQRNIGVQHARTLIAAAKQGGDDTSNTDEFPGLAETLLEEVFDVKIKEAQEQLKFKHNVGSN
jgi:hypothetical protein